MQRRLSSRNRRFPESLDSPIFYSPNLSIRRNFEHFESRKQRVLKIESEIRFHNEINGAKKSFFLKI